MKTNKKRCLLMLIVFITLLLTVSTINAADEVNQTTSIVKSNQSSSINDYDYQSISQQSQKQYNKTKKTSNNYIYVNSNADESSNGTSQNNPSTLSKAIENAGDNQEILLVTNNNQDTYKFTQQIYINSNQNNPRNITIIGQNGKTIMFDGQNDTGLFNLRYVSLTLKNIVITNVNYYSNAIYASNSNITFINCTINNKNPSNAHLIGSYSSNLSLNNTIVENNHIKGSNSVIYVSGGKLTVYNSTFRNNVMENRGVISTLNSQNILQNSQFTNNTSQKTAPVIYAKDSQNTIQNSKFTNNHGNESGATYFLESNTTIQNSEFVNNLAQQLGGAITQLGSQTLNITKSSFTSNNAVYDGGCVYSIQSNVWIQSSKFTSNKARNGGALYLANNVNKISINVLDNTFSSNQATTKGDSIWSNYNININNNVFYSTRKNNWVRLEENYNNTVNENWWSTNAPNFNVITDGIVPDNWRLMTVINKTNVNTKQVTVSLNSLSDYTQTTKALPSRTAIFTADYGNFTKKSLSITGSVTNNYTGNSTNLTVKIDNQEVIIYTKRDAYLSINNITTTPASQVTFVIRANQEISTKVTLKVNNVTLTSQLANGYTTINYTIPSAWKANNYTTTLTMTSTSKYATKTISGHLLLKEDNITITTINSTDLKVLTSTLPSSYDLRNQNLVSSVKTQGSSGSCWAFSSLASLESVLLRKTGIEYDFSENNMKNLLKKYSTIGDKDGEPNSGNNDFEPISFLTGWYGPVTESEDPYDASSILSPILNSSFQIQDIYIIPERKSATDNELIKQAIYNYGAVSTGIYLSGKNTYNTQKSINHGVVIVGWDDNYSKTNFSPNPPANGAFIVKNSWGPNSGDNGYYYVSYYDTTIGSLCNSNDTDNEQLNYVILMENNENYTNVYQHDSIVNALSTYSDFVAYKNIYTATKDENIAAFGTYFLQKSDYQVEILVNGKSVYTQKATVTLPGYRTIKLNKYVQVNKGDEFEIIVKINRTKTGHNYILVQYSDLYHAPIKAGQSFLEFDDDDGRWMDLYDYECVAPLKVYTKDVPTLNNTITYANEKITITTKISNVKANGTLKYYINGKELIVNNKTATYEIKKDSTITLTFQDNIKQRYLNLTTQYVSENYRIIENKTFDTKHEVTNITITANKTAYIADNLIISGKLTSQTPLANAQINIKINSQSFNVTTDKNGKYQLSYNVTKTGENKVTVEYKGNTTYFSTYAQTTFTADKKQTRILLYTKTPLDVGTTTKISGKLLFENEAIKGETVSINVNSNKYTAKTDVYGYFTINYTIRTYDDIKVVYTYAGNTYYKSTNNTITYTVKRPTEIFIYTIYNTNYGKTIKISGKLLSNSSAVNGQKVKIKVNNNQTFTTTSDANGYFTINYTVNSYKNHTVSFTYDGANNYMSSKNSTTFVVKQPTTLYIYSRSADEKGTTIKVSGKLLSNGEGLKGLTVNITVNDKKYSATTVGYGYFTINYTINSYDDLNVTYRFAGNSLYESCTNKTVYTVKKLELFMYSRSGDTIGSTIKVSGKLLYGGDGVKGETISISVNGKKYTAVTVGYGYFTVNYTITSYNDLNVTFNYAGSSQYSAISNSTVYTVKKPVELFMYSRSGDKVGSTIKVSGKLLYNGVGVKGETISINVNGKKYTAVTVGYGYFTVNYTITSYNDLNVTFTYAGSSGYLPVINSTVYTVKKPVELFMYSRSGDKVGSTIKVSGKLLYGGDGVKGETISISVNGKKYTAVSVGYGYFTVNYTITGYNDLNVTFAYNGSSKYLPVTNSTVYTVVKS